MQQTHQLPMTAGASLVNSKIKQIGAKKFYRVPRFMPSGVFTDTQLVTMQLPSFFVYFILTLNFDATTRQKPLDI